MDPVPAGTLAFHELVERLAGAGAGAITVVTPNQRLAQALAQAVDREHLAAGRASWPAPDIQAWRDWLERLHDEAALDDSAEPVAPRFSVDQELFGWEDVIARDASRHLLAGAATLAREAQGAWSLAHEWGIEGAIGSWEGGEDALAFAGWAAGWRALRQKRGWIDAAQLADTLPQILAHRSVRKPALLVAYAFHIVTPAQRRVLAACAQAGITVLEARPPSHDGAPRVVELESPQRELERAARWARARLEAAPQGRVPRIAVVVPDIGPRRERVRRIFARVFAPSGRAAAAPLVNLSLGKPLAEYPLVDCALALLSLAAEPVPYEDASRLLRSPFLGEAEAEFASRARLDATLRRSAPPLIDLEGLRAQMAATAREAGRRSAPPCPALEGRFAAVAALKPPPRSAPPHLWAAHFAQCLAAAGFPGERGLDSAEYQTLAKWHEVLTRLGSLGAVAATLTGEAARRHLRQFCLDTVFQAESGDAPVQVLGLLESVGLDFDALWVTGLTDDAWPQSPRPNPFLPVSLQRKAGVPQASAENSLDLDRRITRAWAGAAPEVVFSHARADEDRALAASPLIAGYAAVDVEALDIPAYEGLREALFAAGAHPDAWDGCADRRAPPVAAAAVRGGTAILADQAACPFRAFARHRLGAEGVDRIEPGLGPAERGQLVHTLMARVWRELRSHARLMSLDPAQLEALVAEAARLAVAKLRAERPGRLEGLFADLERARLARVAQDWLSIDRERMPFEVVLREDALQMQAGGLALHGRIDRLDRIAGAGLAVIDYKTGSPRVAGWLGERPDDPQLPLYALAAGEEVAAVAFACLKAGKHGFAGLAREEGLLPDVKTVEKHATARKLAASWQELLDGWRTATGAVAASFAAGEAPVDPKRAAATCASCDLAALCRVHERPGCLAADEEADGEDGAP